MYPTWLLHTFVLRGKIEVITDNKDRRISPPSRSQLRLFDGDLRISFSCGSAYAKNIQRVPFLPYPTSTRWNMSGAIDSDPTL
jgi:hypothetical protein